MRFVVRGRERPLVSALEAVVGAQSLGYIEGLARDILEPATAGGVVEFRSPQGFAIATAMADAQSGILPEFSFRAEALRRMNVSTEATSADRTNARHRAQQFDLREGLRRPQHQQSSLLLRRHALVQHFIYLIVEKYSTPNRVRRKLCSCRCLLLKVIGKAIGESRMIILPETSAAELILKPVLSSYHCM